MWTAVPIPFSLASERLGSLSPDASLPRASASRTLNTLCQRAGEVRGPTRVVHPARSERARGEETLLSEQYWDFSPRTQVTGTLWVAAPLPCHPGPSTAE